MSCAFDAYLDIETTGLSWRDSTITVIGFYMIRGDQRSLLQLVGQEITRDSLTAALAGVQTIFTYNGSRFDLPFIRSVLSTDLGDFCGHHDLMVDCWKNNLYGGLKAVERRLGIPRQTQGIMGRDAIALWHRYQRDGDGEALKLLLQYNREDVINLSLLREKLASSRL